jgi:hypothetical protein
MTRTLLFFCLAALSGAPLASPSEADSSAAIAPADSLNQWPGSLRAPPEEGSDASAADTVPTARPPEPASAPASVRPAEAAPPSAGPGPMDPFAPAEIAAPDPGPVGGWICIAAGAALGIAGIAMMNASETEVTRTRTVEPFCPWVIFGAPCDEEPRTETYTETETDWELQLLGVAALGAAGGLLTGGIIRVATYHPRRSASAPVSGPDGIRVTWTGRF